MVPVRGTWLDPHDRRLGLSLRLVHGRADRKRSVHRFFPGTFPVQSTSAAQETNISIQFTTVAVLHRRLSIPKMLLHWVITFFGNLAGSLFIVSIITGYGGVFDAATYRNEVHTFVTTKQVTPSFHQVFLRGIGANWLVCLACFLGMSGREYVSKIVGIWWPTFAFVSLGLDHGKQFCLWSLDAC